MPIDTGDTIHHKPTGETWLVAYSEGGYVCCCGWPESLAKIEDCFLQSKAAPEDKTALLREMRKLPDSRGAYARRMLPDAN